MSEESTIINLGYLVSEHATNPKDKNLYIDEVKVFLNTLDFYYLPKDKIREKIENYKGKLDIQVNTTYTFKEVVETWINMLQELLEE